MSNCKEKQRATHLNQAVTNLMQYGEELFLNVLEEVRRSLPTQEELLTNLQSIAEQLSVVLQYLSEELKNLMNNSAAEVQEVIERSIKTFEHESERLNNSQALESPGDAAMQIKNAMAASYTEIMDMIQKLRPHADQVSHKMKEAMEYALNDINKIGDEMKNMISEAMNKT